MKPTNPDGSPLEILNFVRIVHWSGDDFKTLETWTGYEWNRVSDPIIAIKFENIRDAIIAIETAAMRVGRETRWGLPITRDSNTGVEVMPTTDPNTSHLPAGERIGQVAIECHHGPKDTDPIYFNVHLWNGFGWVNVGPGHFNDEKTATIFANHLTGKFDETSDGGLCHMGHDFACRRCGARRREAPALAGEAPETHAEIISVAPGAGSFPRDELFTGGQMRELATAIMDFQTTEPVPEQGTLRIRPDLIDPARKWIIYHWDDTARSWIPAPRFAPCDTYWSAVNAVNDSPLISKPVRMWHPTQQNLDRWAQQGFMVSPPGGAHTPEQIIEATRQILDPVIIPAVPPVALGTPTPVGACEMRPGDMPGDCWNVVTWNGHTWRQIASNVSKRTAETVVTAVKNNPPEPSIKATVIKEYRKVIQRTRDNLSHLRRIVEANPNDTNDILSKINQIIDEINENNY